MADPPWDIHMELPYGTMTDEEMKNMRIKELSDDGLFFLWVRLSILVLFVRAKGLGNWTCDGIGTRTASVVGIYSSRRNNLG